MEKNYIEKSLKRFLKRRIKITLSVITAFMITGTVGFAADFTKEAILECSDGTPLEITNEKLILDNKDLKENSKNGILCHNNGKLLVNSSDIIINNSVVNGTLDKGYNLAGVQVRTGGEIILGTESTKDINIKIHVDSTTTASSPDKEDIANGIFAWRLNGDNGGKITINSENLNIDVTSEKGFARGIYVYNATTPGELPGKERAEVIIKSKNTIINAKTNAKEEGAASDGIIAWSQGKVKINDGNVSITADRIINTRGNSLVEINANNDSQNTVVLNGDILFEYDEVHSGTTVDSGVNINLSNQDSKFTGKIISTENIPEGKNEVTGMSLGLSNGGIWEVTGDSFVNDLTMNSGVLEVTENVNNIDISRLHGNSGTVAFSASIDEDNVKVTDGKLNIGEAKEGTELEVGLSGVNADDLAQNNIDPEKALGQLTDKVVTENGNVEEIYYVDGGALTGKITAEADENGKITNIKQEKETPITGTIKDLATINYLSWKQEMGNLTQRMGELRDSSAEYGVWYRVYGGKVENGSQYDNKYQTYQVGYDKKYTIDNGKVYLGYLVSYTDGETYYALGHGENYSVGAGIYATWLNNNGHYFDIMYKVSRLNNKFSINDIEKLAGEYNTYGMSLSAEYGKRFDITEKWFAEPSIGMHLGRLENETYTTNSGIEVSQDSIYIAEGRVGTAIGYKFSDKGNVYARTHLVKEFSGDIDTEYEREGVSAKVSEDMGDTWLEFGIGVNYRFTEDMNIYADIEKSGDSAVDTKWQGNIGFRYEF